MRCRQVAGDTADNDSENLKTMKKILILILLSTLFACQKEPVFTLAESSFRQSYHGHYILVENMPKDRMELKRLMIHHFLHLTSTIDSLQTSPDLTGVYCTFLKSTSSTRKRFSFQSTEERYGRDTYFGAGERNSFGWYNNRTLIGKMSVTRCEKHETTLNAVMSINLGTNNDDFREGKINNERIILFDECETDWNKYLKAKKNEELEKYFIEQKKETQKVMVPVFEFLQ